MVNRNLIRTLDLSEEEWQLELNEALEAAPPEELEWGTQEVAVNQIVQGGASCEPRETSSWLVDVGYKSEGIIFRSEWEEGEELPKPGQMIKVLIEDVEDIHGLVDDSRGMITLSKRKAEKIAAWLGVMETVHEDDVVTGVATKKIKGGLLVDIGVSVFLPASQVDIRRPADIGDYIGRTVQALVLKIDEARRNIVVSRQALIEAERAEKKAQLLAELELGQRPARSVVKNIADFGAFVDLGGIDGLLHITDMSWGRINHPSEMVAIDQEIEVQILHIDYEKEKIALGLKQKSPSPWENVPAKYPVGKQIKGTVVNVMSYGAFVKLEEGIRRLGHTSAKCLGLAASAIPANWSKSTMRSRSSCSRSTKRSHEISLEHEADPGEPTRTASRTAIRRALWSRAPSATSQTTGPSSRSRRGSTVCCTSAICPGPVKSAIPTRWSKRATCSNAACFPLTRNVVA